MLGVIATLYASHHETFTGGVDDPSPEALPGLVRDMVAAIIVYAVCATLKFLPIYIRASCCLRRVGRLALRRTFWSSLGKDPLEGKLLLWMVDTLGFSQERC